MYEYSCIINRVIDGDTVDVDIDLGFGVWLKDQRIRLEGIDAPETRTRDLEEKKAGLEATEFVKSLLPAGSEQTLQTLEFNKGKYGRIIGDFIVYDNPNDRFAKLTTILLESEMVEKYNADD